ncbi:Re/Si-specific NAD(P)(+) transhydrogenase subunit alpha [Falsochrobactrum sp. TDYN1]|uniref:NAD(P) transhydrogenase subunit alpha part 1 n=1 Tax=Falsochrobactrum tianjinense TaxID=2706015 RepID=A0A949UUT2_9HYPH|nr:Re/Si-specific NAD(P)(+) transhydrogenase subunit alpha [Falsochrobactrum sp. TDYN1]MBV2144132.1 Re/Si-specific NAD(P)(+) transhydrogenase subunit alpha [Falsochrobactrum sp. TDYN1]
MAQTIFIPKESDPSETRVAASAETVKKFIALGFDVVVEKSAGEKSRIIDAEFSAAGASIGTVADAKSADIVLKVRRPTDAELKNYKSGAALFAMLDPHGHEDSVVALAKAGISAFTMEFMPRITRAQVMDVLSSQANLAGYQAVIDAAEAYDRAMPMMMTAAGTVPAARVFVMGAGVAGLQAIATARRLGAVVTATDVRPAAKEQVASLGAKFIAVEDEEFKAAETAGGYAKEMSKEYQAKQAALVADHIAKQDIVITTALIPGRPAPRLVTRQMVAAMRPGSVLVDLAVERGGNVEGASPGKIVDINGVKIVGYLNMPGRIAATASQLYARNLFAFLDTLVDKETKSFGIDPEEELVKATLLTHKGRIVHPAFEKASLAADAGTEAKAKTKAEKPKSAPRAPRKTGTKMSAKAPKTSPKTSADGGEA